MQQQEETNTMPIERRGEVEEEMAQATTETEEKMDGIQIKIEEEWRQGKGENDQQQNQDNVMRIYFMVSAESWGRP